MLRPLTARDRFTIKSAGPPGRDERRYQSLVQAFSDIVWRTDADGRLLIDMPSWREVTGQTTQELLGLGWLEGVHADDRDRVARTWADAVRTGSLFASEYRITGPGGTRHLEVRGAPVPDDDGETVEWVGWAADVTSRALAEGARTALEAELASERRALERVVEQAPAAIAVLWGPDHTYRFFNARYEEMVPAGGDLHGRTVGDVLPEAAEALRLLDRAFAGEEIVHRQFPVPFADARSFEGNRFYDFTYSPIHDRGRPAGVLVIAMETTEEVRLRADLERRLMAEQAVAERLQRAVLPEQVPPVEGLELVVRYLPASEDSGVGGDWYDAIPLPEGRTLLVIGDVAGRGLQAATVMVQLRSALRAFAVEDPRPSEVLRRLAHHTLALELADLVTVMVALVDPSGGHLTYASAGHPPLLLIPPDGEPRIEWTAAGPPIGAPMAGHQDVDIDLPPGTTVLLYTDGLVEERGVSLDVTLEQLRRSASGHHDNLDALCDRLVEERRLEDDTALLACRRLPVPADLAPSYEQRFPAEPISVSAVRHAVARVAAAAGFDDEGLGKVKLAVSEAATNAVLHAYRDRTEAGDLFVRAEVAEGELRVMIVDRGTGIRPRDDSPGLGLGLGMISALTTRVDFVNARPGTEVHMAWRM